MENKPREIVIHQCCNRPQLLLGGDRELVLLSAMMAGMLTFALGTWWGAVSGVLLWMSAVAVLSRMGKADPLLRQTYIRHVRYQPYYPAKSPVAARAARTPLSWPR